MGKKIFAFDLDGTLTQHKSKIDNKNLLALRQLQHNHVVVIVGAGSCERISKQIYGINLQILGQYGLEFAELDDKDNLSYIFKHQIPVDRKNVEKKIEFLRKMMGFDYFDGDGVEFHESGVITFPILGTRADLANKIKFDPDRKIRRKLLPKIKEFFSESNVFIGGSSSYDIVPKNFNKYIAIKNFLKNNSFCENDLVYFGDDYGEGGNDEDVYKSNIDFVEINSYEEVSEKIKEWL